MSAEENKAAVRREVEELYNHTGNLDVADEIFSPDYVSYEPTSGETRGIEGARQFAATFREAFPDLQCTIDDMVAEGDKVVMRFRGSGTHQGETETFGPMNLTEGRLSQILHKALAKLREVHSESPKLSASR